MSEVHPAWDGIFEPGETILWQGAPDGSFRYQLEHPVSIAIGLGLVAISAPNLPTLFAERTPMIIFPLMVFCLGLYSLIGKNFYDAWQRKGTFYTLTTKRAFIGSRNYKGKTLESYVITPENRIRLKGKEQASVFFTKEPKRGDIGFRYIQDATEVLDHLRHIQDRQKQ